jgi:hypothetical protein
MPEVHIQIKIQGDGFASEEELKKRNDLEDAIEAQKLGEIVDAGTGMGVMDLFVEVADDAQVRPALEKLVAQFGLTAQTSISQVATIDPNQKVDWEDSEDDVSAMVPSTPTAKPIVTRVEAKPKAKAKAKAKAKTKTRPAAKAKSKAKPKSKVKAKSKAKPKAKAKSKPKKKSKKGKRR